MLKNNYEVDILINGKRVQEYLQKDKMYIEGRKGTKYSIKINNNSWEKIIAIPTVDGISVINGKLADYNSTGYIINSHSSITIDGWRKNDKEVAEFYFSNTKDSYARRVGKNGNQGVIGVAIYKEQNEERNFIKRITEIEPIYREVPMWYNGSISNITTNIDSCSSITTASCSLSALKSSASQVNCCFKSQQVGTGWGEIKHSEVINSSFNKDNSSLTVFEIFYNTRKELEKQGITFNKVTYISSPKAFPNEYCETPRR